jgi:F-box-like
MYDLPDEVIETIFSMVPCSLFNLTLVCKKFNNLIGNCKRLMTEFEVNFTDKFEEGEKFLQLAMKLND